GALALPPAIPPEAFPPFAQAGSRGVWLGAQFQGQGFAISLLVGGREMLSGMGEEHFYHMLHGLALCTPTVAEGSALGVPEEFGMLGERTMRGEITLVILPWPDPSMQQLAQGVSRVFHLWEMP